MAVDYFRLTPALQLMAVDYFRSTPALNIMACYYMSDNNSNLKVRKVYPLR